MTTLMPTDANDNPIPALKLKTNGAHKISATASTSARNTTAFTKETRIVSLYSDAPVFVNFGESSVTADTNSHYFPGGVYYDFAIGGDRNDHTPHIAVIAVSGTADVYISEKV